MLFNVVEHIFFVVFITAFILFFAMGAFYFSVLVILVLVAGGISEGSDGRCRNGFLALRFSIILILIVADHNDIGVII